MNIMEYVPFMLTIGTAVAIGIIVLIEVKSIVHRGEEVITDYEKRLDENTAAMKELKEVLKDNKVVNETIMASSKRIIETLNRVKTNEEKND